jgi:DNA-binding MarR family transcriptional regulator
MSEHAISIELSRAQIKRVVRDAARQHGLLGRIGGVQRREFQVTPEQLEDPRLSHSFLLGLVVLASFPADGVGRSVKDVAGEMGMWASTTHRYMSTLVEIGLLERDPVSREYRRPA